VAGGRRNIMQNFWGSENTIVEHLKVETTCKNIFSTLPAEFCPKTFIFAHFWLVKNLLSGREQPETRRRTNKKI